MWDKSSAVDLGVNSKETLFNNVGIVRNAHIGERRRITDIPKQPVGNAPAMLFAVVALFYVDPSCA